ncbi:hypothetical protein M595_3340 [Lyngbya aestuarii BL J]|uniref:Uncharacterized protein n=1 Tax=Lyngbya aestuarii BL J TaxID=1348334 RepID=U7QHZ6_9CYAN|nr:hypothetical protein M595_3340 [Lyngbya aestuarii BL J]
MGEYFGVVNLEPAFRCWLESQFASGEFCEHCWNIKTYQKLVYLFYCIEILIVACHSPGQSENWMGLRELSRVIHKKMDDFNFISP